MVRTVRSHSKLLIHWISVLRVRMFVPLFTAYNVSFLMLDPRRKLFRQSADNVHTPFPVLEIVCMVIRTLVRLIMRCPLTTSLVKKVTTVANWLRLLPMYSAK